MAGIHLESKEWREVAMEALWASLFGALPYALVFLWPSPIFGKVFAGLSRMRSRNPSTFNAFFAAVNLMQVLLCSWVIYLIMDMGFFNGFEFFCPTSAYVKLKEAKTALNACCYYHLSNILAFIDTVCMKINRKEVTFLHVYHHSSAFVWSWIVSKLVPGGRSLFSVVGISIAHTAIYLYYFLLLIGIQLNRHICWTALTLLQMILIALGIFYMSVVFFYDCKYPKSVAVIYVFFSLILFLLFVHLFLTRQRTEFKTSSHKKIM